ncbi:MAG: response regulator [Roseibium sp.]|uniref:ATP-binding protein n=1 Tax=Roseibium sp. TaxID=1936156 RepID=UPI0026175F53|nr:ATP-binding protein [Roseibium sp.]MCV0425073.1 response regulator [Roseibium sp.]
MLDRADIRIEKLHRQTLSEVTRALRLSKQSSDIATSAPFLLSIPSDYLISREEQKLAETLDQIANDWPIADASEQSPVYTFAGEISNSISYMKSAIGDLAHSADQLNFEREAASRLADQLAVLESEIHSKALSNDISEVERRNWLALQAMTTKLLSAAHAENLMGVGEYHRAYHSLSSAFRQYVTDERQVQSLEQMEMLSDGVDGLFEIRRRELSHNLSAQNALFRIRLSASAINDMSANFAANAEQFLSEEQSKTANTIEYYKFAILAFGLGSIVIASASAVFVSNYVTGNIKSISQAMLRLADGDRGIQGLDKPTADDEIGKLQYAFRVFRANALRLDRSNRRLYQQIALFERTFLNISDGVAITAEDGKLKAANPNFSRTLRLDSTINPIGKHFSNVLRNSPFNQDETAQNLNENFMGYCEIRTREKDVLEVRKSDLPDGGSVWLFSDATERRQVEERLHQIQHIESLGKITGEVAHDFGNVLSNITTNIHLIEENNSNPDFHRFLERSRVALDIGSSLVQRMLAFARKQALAPEVVELNELVDGLIDLIEIGLKDTVQLNIVQSRDPVYVLVDPGQLESALLNLSLNANQAIAEDGTIDISIENTNDNTATITVRDTGSGMDDAVLSRAFEPFFTARADGKGTGLGLSMVYGFMKQSGGDITIESTPCKGTEVRLVFRTIEPRPIHWSETESTYEKTAILVEDDPETMRHATRCLHNEGYTVISAGTFEEALKIIDTNENYQLLITDLHLNNGASGRVLAERSLERFPETRVIIMSGRLPELHKQPQKIDRLIGYLAKPLSQENLHTALVD